ncbi:cyclophilin-like fold protein [Chloroflexota bacterium]
MERQIRIIAGPVIVVAELYNTKTAEAIWQALPFNSKGNTWGDEIYFRIPVKIGLESGKEIVDSGDLGYWPAGRAFCIFFGSTPVSAEGEIRAASAVDIFGKLAGDPNVFKNIKDGEEIVVERA